MDLWMMGHASVYIMHFWEFFTKIHWILSHVRALSSSSASTASHKAFKVFGILPLKSLVHINTCETLVVPWTNTSMPLSNRNQMNHITNKVSSLLSLYSTMIKRLSQSLVYDSRKVYSGHNNRIQVAFRRFYTTSEEDITGHRVKPAFLCLRRHIRRKKTNSWHWLPEALWKPFPSDQLAVWW